MLSIERTEWVGKKRQLKFWFLSWVMLASALVPILTLGLFDCGLYFDRVCSRWYNS